MYCHTHHSTRCPICTSAWSEWRNAGRGVAGRCCGGLHVEEGAMKWGRVLKSPDDCSRLHEPHAASLPPHFHVARRDGGPSLESCARPRAPEEEKGLGFKAKFSLCHDLIRCDHMFTREELNEGSPHGLIFIHVLIRGILSVYFLYSRRLFCGTP